MKKNNEVEGNKIPLTVEELFEKYIPIIENAEKKINTRPFIKKREVRAPKVHNVVKNEDFTVKGVSLVAESLSFVRSRRLEEFKMTERVCTELPIEYSSSKLSFSLAKKPSTVDQSSLIITKDTVNKERKVYGEIKRQREKAEIKKPVPDWAIDNMIGSGNSAQKNHKVKFRSKYTYRNVI